MDRAIFPSAQSSNFDDESALISKSPINLSPSDFMTLPDLDTLSLIGVANQRPSQSAEFNCIITSVDGNKVAPEKLIPPFRNNLPAHGRRHNELSHNKAVTKKLVSASSHTQILECVESTLHTFDCVNIVTAIHRLAKLRSFDHRARVDVTKSSTFLKLVDSVKQFLPQFEAQAISNTLWAFATILYNPDKCLLEEICQHAVCILHTFRPQAIANTMWALAKLNFLPSDNFIEAVVHRMKSDMGNFVPQDISNTLWAFMTLGMVPDEDLMSRIAHCSLSTIGMFKPQEAANLLFSIAVLQKDPPVILLDVLVTVMARMIDMFKPQAISNVLWAFANLEFNPGPLFMSRICGRAANIFKLCSAHELSTILWAVATLEYYPGEIFLNLAAHQLIQKLGQFGPLHLTKCVWAFAIFYFNPCPAIVQPLSQHLSCFVQLLDRQSAFCMMESIALLNLCPLESWPILISKLTSYEATTFQEKEYISIFKIHLLLEAASRSMGMESLSHHFSPKLLMEAKQVWKANVLNQKNASQHHAELSHTLSSMGICHTSNERVVDDLFSVDIKIDGTQIIIQMQEMDSYAANCYLPLGKNIGRSILLEAEGFYIIDIPHFEWTKLNSVGERLEYLSKKIALTTSHMISLVAQSPYNGIFAQG